MSERMKCLIAVAILHLAVINGGARGQSPHHLARRSEQVAVNRSRHMIVTSASPCSLRLDAAIAAFKLGDVSNALRYVDEGLALCPGDLQLLEFRGLVFFAKADYQAASVDLHRVIAAGSSWNWATIHSLYPDVGTYTKHLRVLETFSRKHPDDGSARFVQAYHYNADGYPAVAARELEMVVRLEFNDPIAVQFLKKLAIRTQ